MPHKARSGKLAELLVEKLAAEAGVVVNRVQDDQHGWDLIVGFSSPTDGRPADIKAAPTTCLIQVKSSSKSSSAYRMKLSNALRFAKHSLPCFIIKIEFRSDDVTPHAWYLQHFWTNQIEQSLKVARQQYGKGNDDPRGVIVTFRLGPDDRIEPGEIMDRVLEIVSSEPNYAARKSKYGDEVGYEDGYGAGQFSLSGDKAISTLVDMLIGVGNEVEVENFSYTPARFGIPERVPLHTSTKAKLTAAVAPVAACHVTLTSRSDGEQITLQGGIFFPAIPGLPKELQKARVNTSVFDLTFSPFKGKGNVNVSVDFERSYELGDLYNVAAIFSWIQSGPIDFEVWYDGRIMFSGELYAQMPEGSPQWKGLAYSLKALRDFAPLVQLPAGLQFSITHFSDVSSLIKLTTLLGAKDASVSFSMSGAFQDPRPVKEWLWPFYFELGPATYFGVVLYEIENLEIGTDSLHLTLRKGQLVARAVRRGSIADNREYIDAQITRAGEQHALKRADVLFYRPQEIL